VDAASVPAGTGGAVTACLFDALSL